MKSHDHVIPEDLFQESIFWNAIFRNPCPLETYYHAMNGVCVAKAINIPYDLIANFKSLTCQLWAFKQPLPLHLSIIFLTLVTKEYDYSWR